MASVPVAWACGMGINWFQACRVQAGTKFAFTMFFKVDLMVFFLSPYSPHFSLILPPICQTF